MKVSMPCCENSECVALQFTIRLECDSVSLLVEVVKSVLDSNRGNFSEEVKVSFVLGVLWVFLYRQHSTNIIHYCQHKYESLFSSGCNLLLKEHLEC